MPIDVIRCEKCGHSEDKFRANVNDETEFPEKCPKCGASKKFLYKGWGSFNFDVGGGRCGNSASGYGTEYTYKPSTRYGSYKNKKRDR